MKITLSNARDSRTFEDIDLHTLLDWARLNWGPAQGPILPGKGRIVASDLMVSIDGEEPVTVREAVTRAGIPTC